jgi:hypothetical protein
MRGERLLLRAGGYLVGLACQRLPRGTRQERYREWTAELPAILHDPQTRPAALRAARMLSYAADTLRGSVMTTSRTRHRDPVFLVLFLIGAVAWRIWTAVRVPGDGQNYLQLAWALLFLAYAIGRLAHCTTRAAALLLISSTLMLVAADCWAAAQAPADWVNYPFPAALVLLAGWWLIRRWTATRRA